MNSHTCMKTQTQSSLKALNRRKSRNVWTVKRLYFCCWYEWLTCLQKNELVFCIGPWSTYIKFHCISKFTKHKLFQLDTFKTSLINSPRKQAWIRSTVCVRSFKLLPTRTFTLSCPADCNTSCRACLRRSSSLFSSSNELMPCNKTNVLKQLDASCNQ